MAIKIKLLNIDDLDILLGAGSDVFDNKTDPSLAKSYLERDDYYIAVALDNNKSSNNKVIGMASGFTYFHPDKPVEFFVNEVGVHDNYLRQGIGKLLTQIMFDCARDAGCTYCWLATETDNDAANALYRSLDGKESKINFFEYDLTQKNSNQ